MCYACWIENGRAAAVSQATIDTARSINRLYECAGGEAGGALHIVLDGWNIWDRSLAYCRHVVDGRQRRHALSDPALMLAERDVLKCLEDLSLGERCSALALSEDMIAMPASLFLPRRKDLRSHRPHPGVWQAALERRRRQAAGGAAAPFSTVERGGSCCTDEPTVADQGKGSIASRGTGVESGGRVSVLQGRW